MDKRLNELMRQASIQLNNGIDADPDIFIRLGIALRRLHHSPDEPNVVYVVSEESLGESEIISVSFSIEDAQISVMRRVELIIRNYGITEIEEDLLDDLNSDDFDKALNKINRILSEDRYHALKVVEAEISDFFEG